MSCSVCAGYSSDKCPCCGEGERWMKCPDCDGKGVVYLAFHIDEHRFRQVTELAYTILPENEDEARYMKNKWCKGVPEVCDTCHGEGEIPESY